MKLTKRQLQRIIQEELDAMLSEVDPPRRRGAEGEVKAVTTSPMRFRRERGGPVGTREGSQPVRTPAGDVVNPPAKIAKRMEQGALGGGTRLKGTRRTPETMGSVVTRRGGTLGDIGKVMSDQKVDPSLWYDKTQAALNPEKIREHEEEINNLVQEVYKRFLRGN